MFQSPVLDRLTRVHPAVPPLVFGPAIVALLVLAMSEMSIPGVLLAFLCRVAAKRSRRPAPAAAR